MTIHWTRGAMPGLLALALTLLPAGCGGGASTPPAVLPPSAPTVVISGTLPAPATGPTTLTFTFSEPVSSFPASAVTVTGGTAGAPALVDPTHGTLVVTPPAGATGTERITVAAGAFTDAAGLANTLPASASQTFDTLAPALPGWTLSWSDEFDGPDGSAPDPARWTYDLGGSGWGNGELESYTARPANVQVSGGDLVITALRENYTGADGLPCAYTSGRIRTQGLFSQAYGRFEARIKIPRGQGLWPAFWMLGDTIATVDWPACGEIDIMENIGAQPGTVYGSIHGPGFTGGSLSTSYALPPAPSPTPSTSMPWNGSRTRSICTWTRPSTRPTRRRTCPAAPRGSSTSPSS